MEYTFIWDIHPELPFLRQFVPIRYYSLCFSGGLMIAFFIVKRLYQEEGLNTQNLEDLAVYIFTGTIIGARLGHCLFYEPSYFLSRPLEIFLPIRIHATGMEFIGYRGLASHGGTIGIFLAIALFCYRYKQAMWPILDKIALVASIAGCFIRVGNFMNSEIIGIPTNANYGVIFKHIDVLPRHPAQLYEAICYFLIFVSLLIFYRKRRSQLAAGFIFGLFFVVLFTVRFFIEFVKINQVTFEEGLFLNMGQLLSLPMIGVGLFVMITSRKISGIEASSF